MMKLSILIALFVFANVSVADPGKENVLYCIQKEGANEEAVKAEFLKLLYGLVKTISKPARCVLDCIFEKYNLISPQRQFNMEMLRITCLKLTRDTIPQDELNYLLKSCESKATSTDRCEFVWSFVSCVEKKLRPYMPN